MSWPLSEIGNHIERISTWNPSIVRDQKVFNYIDLGSVDKEKKEVRKSDVAKVTPSKAPSRARQIVKSGDVIIATVRPNLNGIALIPEELDGATASTGYCVLRSDEKELHNRYLYYWAQTSAFIADMVSKSTGANYPAVSDKVIKESRIPLPPVTEQKRIALILDKANIIRRKRQQARQAADDFIRSVFLDMFGDPETNPKRWKILQLKDIVDPSTVVTYGIIQAGPEVEDGVPYIRTGDFEGGKLAQCGYAKTHPNIAAKFERSRVRQGDLVYCIRASVGSVDIVPMHLDGANLTQGTARISPGECVLSGFLVEYLRRKGFRFWVDRYAKGATFKEITLTKLREAPVYLPPIKRQEEFVDLRNKVLNSLELKYKLFNEPLFESLSMRAFSGKL